MTTEQTTEVKSTALSKWYDKQVTALPPDLIDVAQMLMASGVCPEVKNVAEAAVKVWFGRQLGIEDMTAIRFIFVIPGKGGKPMLYPGYQIIASQIAASGRYKYRVLEHTEEICRIAFFERGLASWEQVGVSTFTIEDARRAGTLRDGSAWKTNPRNMVFKQALRNGASWYCPGIASAHMPAPFDEPYIEGEATEVVAPSEVTWGQDGPPDPWSGFWARCREWGYDKAAVHEFVGVGPEDGALRRAVEQKAENEDKTIAEVLAELEGRLEANARAFQDGDKLAPFPTEAEPEKLEANVDDECEPSVIVSEGGAPPTEYRGSDNKCACGQLNASWATECGRCGAILWGKHDPKPEPTEPPHPDDPWVAFDRDIEAMGCDEAFVLQFTKSKSMAALVERTRIGAIRGKTTVVALIGELLTKVSTAWEAECAKREADANPTQGALT